MRGLAGTVVCVSALCVATAGGGATPQAMRAGGTVVGVVTTREPARGAIRVSIDPDVCGPALPDESISVDAAGRVAGAVLTIAGTTSALPAEAVVSNSGCRFVPRVSLLRPRGAVKMSSADRVMHTMHAAGADGRAIFNLSLPIPNVTLSRSLDRPGVVTLSCSTHTWMRGYIVVGTELAVVSGPDGSFRIEGVPPGVRELRVWHEALRSPPAQVTVRDGETATVAITIRAQ